MIITRCAIIHGFEPPGKRLWRIEPHHIGDFLDAFGRELQVAFRLIVLESVEILDRCDVVSLFEQMVQIPFSHTRFFREIIEGQVVVHVVRHENDEIVEFMGIGRVRIRDSQVMVSEDRGEELDDQSLEIVPRIIDFIGELIDDLIEQIPHVVRILESDDIGNVQAMGLVIVVPEVCEFLVGHVFFQLHRNGYVRAVFPVEEVEVDVGLFAVFTGPLDLVVDVRTQENAIVLGNGVGLVGDRDLHLAFVDVDDLMVPDVSLDEVSLDVGMVHGVANIGGKRLSVHGIASFRIFRMINATFHNQAFMRSKSPCDFVLMMYRKGTSKMRLTRTSKARTASKAM
jgi:hypothetical protein